jgi:hypothetical protein
MSSSPVQGSARMRLPAPNLYVLVEGCGVAQSAGEDHGHMNSILAVLHEW